jgi:flagellar protein FliL
MNRPESDEGDVRDAAEHEPQGKAERVLRGVIVVLAAILVIGTAYALIAGTRGRAAPKEAAVPKVETPRAGEAVYSRIGTIRASTRDKPPAVVAANVAFPYDEQNKDFKEELDDKASRLRDACVAFFSEKSVEELHPAFEGTLKTGLRDRLNSMLSLGKIREVWFSDFAVIQ